MTVARQFPGFPADLFAFLKELADNNNRAWFNEHKDRYRTSVVEPVTGFIAAIAPGLREISPHFIANPKAHGGSMFRIYRDARFSRDKSPYKTHAACQFRHTAGRDAHAPGFYLHLEPDNVFIGGGAWTPPAAQLQKMRAAIADNPTHWRNASRRQEFLDYYGDLIGESLQRAPRGYAPDHADITDLKRKSYFAQRHIESALALTPAFIEETLHGFRVLSPMMDFLTYALDLPYQDGVE